MDACSRRQRSRQDSVILNLERRSRIPEVLRHGQNETPNQIQIQRQNTSIASMMSSSLGLCVV
jgi:hypothetical protein